MRNLGFGLLTVVALLSLADRAWGLGEILGQTMEELKLGYEVVVRDLGGAGRVAIEFALTDEGRLKPLDGVELMVPARETDNADGHFMDLVVPVELKLERGKRVARVQLTRELAERAEIWLTTYWFDGKQVVMSRYHHVIPVGPYLKAAAGGAVKPAGEPGAAAPAATEGKKE
jgi:hypothetical protein